MLEPEARTLVGDFSSPLIEAATQVAEELANHIEQKGTDANLFRLIGRIAEIGYASTPHGRYVMEKGLVTFSPPTA